jgi:hypothetical protein
MAHDSGSTDQRVRKYAVGLHAVPRSRALRFAELCLNSRVVFSVHAAFGEPALGDGEGTNTKIMSRETSAPTSPCLTPPRSFPATLGQDVDADHIAATYQNGVLTVTLPWRQGPSRATSRSPPGHVRKQRSSNPATHPTGVCPLPTVADLISKGSAVRCHIDDDSARTIRPLQHTVADKIYRSLPPSDLLWHGI